MPQVTDIPEGVPGTGTSTRPAPAKRTVQLAVKAAPTGSVSATPCAAGTADLMLRHPPQPPAVYEEAFVIRSTLSPFLSCCCWLLAAGCCCCCWLLALLAAAAATTAPAPPLKQVDKTKSTTKPPSKVCDLARRATALCLRSLVQPMCCQRLRFLAAAQTRPRFSATSPPAVM